MLCLAILYTPNDDRMPVCITRIRDRQLLSVAAETAVREAESTAAQLAREDRTLAELQAGEVDKLRRVLQGLYGPRPVMA